MGSVSSRDDFRSQYIISFIHDNSTKKLKWKDINIHYGTNCYYISAITKYDPRFSCLFYSEVKILDDGKVKYIFTMPEDYNYIFRYLFMTSTREMDPDMFNEYISTVIITDMQVHEKFIEFRNAMLDREEKFLLMADTLYRSGLA